LGSIRNFFLPGVERRMAVQKLYLKEQPLKKCLSLNNSFPLKFTWNELLPVEAFIDDID
jgi:hypothetical protein